MTPIPYYKKRQSTEVQDIELLYFDIEPKLNLCYNIMEGDERPDISGGMETVFADCSIECNRASGIKLMKTEGGYRML